MGSVGQRLSWPLRHRRLAPFGVLDGVFKLTLSSESARHQADHGDVDHCFAGVGIPFVVLGVTTVSD